MKEIYFIRHAKAEKVPNLDSFNSDEMQNELKFGYDFVRNLNETGQIQAKILGKKLKEQGILADFIIASSAWRSKQTAEIIANSLDLKGEFELIYELYEAGVKQAFEFLRKIDNKFERVFIVGHNPTIALVADFLCGDFEIEAFPPSSCLGVRFEVENFSQISQNSGKMVFYHNPKINL